MRENINEPTMARTTMRVRTNMSRAYQPQRDGRRGRWSNCFKSPSASLTLRTVRGTKASRAEVLAHAVMWAGGGDQEFVGDDAPTLAFVELHGNQAGVAPQVRNASGGRAGF